MTALTVLMGLLRFTERKYPPSSHFEMTLIDQPRHHLQEGTRRLRVDHYCANPARLRFFLWGGTGGRDQRSPASERSQRTEPRRTPHHIEHQNYNLNDTFGRRPCLMHHPIRTK